MSRILKRLRRLNRKKLDEEREANANNILQRSKGQKQAAPSAE